MDKLSLILERLSITAGVFFTGEMCGVSTFADDGMREGHIHLLKSGRLDVLNNERDVISIDKPALIFYPRPKVHKLRAVESDNAELVCASIQYGADASNPLTNALPELVILYFDDDDYIASAAKGLFEEAFSEREGKKILMDKLAEIILIHLLRNQLANTENKTGMLAGLAHQQLSQVLLSIHQAPHEHWTLDTMSGLAYMSRSKFAEEFKRVIGQSPGDYLIDWRISVAQNEMKKGKPIAVVANEVGYENTSGLSKAFRKKIGQSPTEWLQHYMTQRA
jgi:AraC-like DNA-binding protein